MTLSRKLLFLVLLAAIALAAVFFIPAFPSHEKRTANLIARFMKRHDIPGAVVAYGSAGKAPTLRAFGLADPETGREMTVSDRFKLASLSKPITSAAMLALIRKDDEIALATTLASLFPQVARSVDPRMADVTIEHLLHHSGGWDRAASFDAFFLTGAELRARLDLDAPSTQGCAPYADAMLALPLDADPGAAYAYSNIGYCWLGRIIEKRTGMSYEAAARQLLSGRLDGLTMENGDVTVAHAVAQQEGEFAALRPEIIAAAGGWIGSAEDYLAFAAGPLDEDVFLSPGFAEGTQYYGLGWRIWNIDEGTVLTHYGSMPGTFSLVARSANGSTLVALFNGRPENDLGGFQELFNGLMSRGLLGE
ncbi:serine hydrolase domain-containing protein [Roseovarius sp. S4756]|uniref:serine hydrolase domain-containing protein n=1 Tax=Roseovarius maritimus TaxID=3342637 RepID=UPI0037290DB2